MPIRKLALGLLLFWGCLTASSANDQIVQTLLNELNFSQDAQVKSSVAKTMRFYRENEEVKNSLISLLSNGMENNNSRVSAMMALAPLGNNLEVKRAITTAHDRSRDISFRSNCLKALYKAAEQDAKIKNVLMQNLMQNHDIRIKEASAFALMNSVSDPLVKETLLRVAQSGTQFNAVRISAIKSLFKVRNDEDVKLALQNLAQGFSDIDVRVAAIKMISTYNRSNQNRDFFLNLIARSGNGAIKAAALNALKFSMTENDVRWLRPSTDPRTRSERNPFEAEF